MWQNRESHIKDETCPIYSDIWQKYGDLNNDEDLVNFFYEVLEKRSKLEFLKMNEDEAPPPAVCQPQFSVLLYILKYKYIVIVTPPVHQG